MKKNKNNLAVLAAFLVTAFGFPALAAQQDQTATNATADRAMVDKTIAGWPERPRLGAQMVISMYGAPQEVTSEKLTWKNPGPYKCITVTKKEDPHDFPLPHTDFMQHTVNYNVPAEKTEELAKFDGSCTFDRTKGELSARCDLEGHNNLTLNLAHDIVTGKKDAAEARKVFGQNIVEDTLGKHPAYVEALQFKPLENQEFADKPTIPGAPVRPGSPLSQKTIKGSSSDGEVLGTVIAIDLNEIVAATVASKKKVSLQVTDYAKMLHEQHGQNADQTMKLGQKINVTPLATPEVDALRVKAAGELAKIVPLDGEEFSRAFLTAMVKGHTEVLKKIDGELMSKASNDQLKKHLTQTRQHVAAHLEMAKHLQSGTDSGAPHAGLNTGTGQDDPLNRPKPSVGQK